MGVRRLLLVMALVAAPSAALASGGGGGGGGGMPSFSAPQYDPVQEYQQGLADYQAEKFKSAAGHFRNVTDAQPKDANTWYMLGEAYSGDGNLKGAEPRCLRNTISATAMAAYTTRRVAADRIAFQRKSPSAANPKTANEYTKIETCGVRKRR